MTVDGGDPDSGTIDAGRTAARDAGATCDDVRVAIAGHLREHDTCGRASDCLRFDGLLPQNDPAFCDQLSGSSANDAWLSTLRERWTELRCGDPFSCHFTPGVPACRNRRCSLDDPATRCSSCPLTLEPQCTVSGQNARNPCFARECLQETIAHPGLCATSASCAAVGGRCEAVDPTVALVPCPDQTAPYNSDSEVVCPGGNLPGTCCVPTGASCTFVANSSFFLDHDPFSCAPTTRDRGVCIQPGLQAGCDWNAASIGEGSNDWDASVRLVASRDGGLRAFGRRGAATFSCEGLANNLQLGAATTWTCTGCSGTDGGCTSCDVAQSAFCPAVP